MAESAPAEPAPSAETAPSEATPDEAAPAEVVSAEAAAPAAEVAVDVDVVPETTSELPPAPSAIEAEPALEAAAPAEAVSAPTETAEPVDQHFRNAGACRLQPAQVDAAAACGPEDTDAAANPAPVPEELIEVGGPAGAMSIRASRVKNETRSAHHSGRRVSAGRIDRQAMRRRSQQLAMPRPSSPTVCSAGCAAVPAAPTAVPTSARSTPPRAPFRSERAFRSPALAATRSSSAPTARSWRSRRPPRAAIVPTGPRGATAERDPDLRAKYIKGRGEAGTAATATDPNSPFAKLAALKEQLEANAKEPH